MGIILLVSGCHYEEIEDFSGKLSKVEEMKAIARNIYLENQQYVLKLTLEDAIKAGISEEEYNKAYAELEAGNQDIKRSLSEGMKIELSDPQEDYINSLSPSLPLETRGYNFKDRRVTYKSVSLITGTTSPQNIYVENAYRVVIVSCSCTAYYWWITCKNVYSESSPYKFTGSLYSTPYYHFNGTYTNPGGKPGNNYRFSFNFVVGAGNGAFAAAKIEADIPGPL